MVICNLSYLQQSTIQVLKYQFRDVFHILELLKFYKYQNGYTQVFRWKAKMDIVLFSEFLRWPVKQMRLVPLTKLIDKQHWSMSSISDCQRKIIFFINSLFFWIHPFCQRLCCQANPGNNMDCQLYFYFLFLNNGIIL